MAEAAIALFASLGTAAASAGTAVASAGTALATGIGSSVAGLASAGSTALSILQGAATAASVASTLVGGLGQAAEAETNAKLAQLQGNADVLASKQKALDIQRDLLVKTGAARVAFAGSGLDISSASAVEGDLKDQAAFNTSIEEENAQQAKLMAGIRARQYRNSGGLDLIGASLKAAGTGANYGIDIAKRG